MKTEAIVAKFLDDEPLLYGGTTAARKVVADLANEEVTVSEYGLRCTDDSFSHPCRVARPGQS